jgi:hypothetical protein
MKLQVAMEGYLAPTTTIDAKHPAIFERTQELIANLHSNAKQTRALFVWVRDAIPHSRDIGAAFSNNPDKLGTYKSTYALAHQPLGKTARPRLVWRNIAGAQLPVEQRLL